MVKQASNQTPEPNRLEQAEQELITLQAESDDIPATLSQAAKDGDTRDIIRLRQRSAELKGLIPAQTIAIYQLREQAYQTRSKNAQSQVAELALLAGAAAERARAATKEENRLMSELSNLQNEAREYLQYASQVASQRSQLLRQMEGQEVDRALRMPLQNPNYGH